MAKFRIPESFDDYTELLETLKDGLRKTLVTALVGIVSEDTKDGHSVKATSAIKATKTLPDGTTSGLAFPAFDDVPIHFPGGGNVVSTHPHKKSTGDEGILLSVARNLDAWRKQGGEQDPDDNRSHTLSDFVMFAGVRSDPRKIDNVSSASGQRRSVDGKHVADLHPENGITHQSEKMVLAQVGQSSSSILTDSGHKVDTGKILLNCG